MNYNRIYNNLISRAQNRPLPTEYTELHHILPTAMGGTDDQENLVRLTLKEHLIAHLLLTKFGDRNQWSSVEAILQDRLNKNRPNRYKHKDLIVTTFFRRNMAKNKAYNIRVIAKQRRQ